MDLKKICYKTWIEINRRALKHNIQTIKKLLRPDAKLWFVVKSNAYGHGLVALAKLSQKKGVNGFCVDSVVEGRRLRNEGISKPILVLGPTLPILFSSAKINNLIITISNWDLLKAFAAAKNAPNFHLKIDTGVHRQGFYPDEVVKILGFIKKHKLGDKIVGTYTHFASAKNIKVVNFTNQQFKKFLTAANRLETGLDKKILKHCAASGATLINKKFHQDAVRVGACLYGIWPSAELREQLGKKTRLNPVLSWHGIVSEVKPADKGTCVGYDQSECLKKNSKIAIIPIGYWHGLDRGLSSRGEILIKNRRAKILGRVCMDLLVVDVTGIPCSVGDKATIVGRQGTNEILAEEIADILRTSAYEIVTRINPLIHKKIV